MCPDPLHYHQSVPIPDLNDQTMLVALDVKDDSVVGQEVRAPISLPDVMRGSPVLPFDVDLPRVELASGVGMFLLVRLEDWQAQDSHEGGSGGMVRRIL
jgi:hypothetical protein